MRVKGVWIIIKILAFCLFSLNNLLVYVVNIYLHYLKIDHITIVQSHFTTETACVERVTEGTHP
jgi:hypothetical protein